MLRLFSYWRSSSAWRVRIALNVKGLAHELVPVNLVALEQFGEAHRARNPMAQVPVLEVTEGSHTVRLSQSMAILEWLDERYPDPPLLPADLDGRARVRMLAEHVNSGIQPLQNAAVLRTLREKWAGYDREWAARWIAEGLGALERALQDGQTGRFCHGDAPGLADCYLVPQLYNARRFGVDVAPFPTLRAIEAACARARAVPGRPPRPPAGRAAARSGGTPDGRARRSSSPSASAASRRCTTTCTTSSGAAASTSTGMDFAEVAASSPELEREGRQRSAVFEAGDVRVDLLRAARRGRARVALPPQAPRRRRLGRVRGRGRRAHLPAARGAGRDARHRRAGAPGRRAARFAPSTSPRRSATPPSASSSGAATAGLYPGIASSRVAEGRRERVRLRDRRPPHLELPDDEAGAPLDGARARDGGVLGGRSSTPRTPPRRSARRSRRSRAPGCARW